MDRIKFYGGKDNRDRVRQGRSNEAIDDNDLVIKVASQDRLLRVRKTNLHIDDNQRRLVAKAKAIGQTRPPIHFLLILLFHKRS